MFSPDIVLFLKFHSNYSTLIKCVDILNMDVIENTLNQAITCSRVHKITYGFGGPSEKMSFLIHF